MKLISSYVSLDKVRFHSNHGVIPQERATGGDFIISVKAGYPLSTAMESDDVDDTLDYSRLYEIISKEMQKPSCLLEHVAGRIGKSIFKELPQVTSLDICVEKLNPPMGGDMQCAAVELHLINDKTI